MSRYRCVVIGTSAGGTEALLELLEPLGDSFNIPIIIVRHRHKEDGEKLSLTAFLEQMLGKRVIEPDDKEPMEDNTIYVAPANYHLLVEKEGFFSLSIDKKRCYSRPSIDVLFESAAYSYGREIIAILLTGANSDGAEGIAAIAAVGGMVFIQMPDSAAFKEMPQAGINRVSSAIVLSLAEISLELMKIEAGKEDV